MLRTVQNGYSEEAEAYGEQFFSETPFADARTYEQEEPQRESFSDEMLSRDWEVTTPFLPGESTEAGESEAAAPEVAAFSEIVAEMKDTLFRESLEQLADEALEANAEQLAGEYGDRETRDWAYERLLNDHFQPLAAQAEAMLDRFFERLESYETEALTDMEIERISTEVLPVGTPMSPASEQFLGGLLRKAGRLVSGAVKGAANLAGKGLKAIGKIVLGPLKKLAVTFLKLLSNKIVDVVPMHLRPLAQTLSDKLFRAIGETNEAEGEAYEQSEAEALPAAHDVAHLEAELDVQVAQLLFTPDEAEIEHLVAQYGEGENYSSPSTDLDSTRAQFVKALSALQPGESPQPVMEQFLPALLPVAKTAITILGRPKLVDFIAKFLGKLIKPLIGADASGMLAPVIADAGLRIFGLETSYPAPHAMLSEALAATVEETVNAIGELPSHILTNETLLSDAIHEAFENAASSYFPNSVIKPELRESTEQHGMWARMPAKSDKKRYAKYSHTPEVEIPARLAGKINTFGSATLHDHLRDQHGLPDGRAFKGKVTLYQALPGTRGSHIARAEGFPPSQLHPLTTQAAGVLLGPSAALGMRPTPAQYLDSPEKLHVNQRLYRLEPPTSRHHRVRKVHAEVLINLQRGEIRLWLYLSEPLCQRVAADLAKANGAALAFKHVKPLLWRITETIKTANTHRHLSPHIILVGYRPNLNRTVPHWFRHAGHHLGAKIGEWARAQVAKYLQNSAEDFKRACKSDHEGVTLCSKMTRVPGMEALRELAHGKTAKELSQGGWPQGTPTFQVVAHHGHAFSRLRY